MTAPPPASLSRLLNSGQIMTDTVEPAIQGHADARDARQLRLGFAGAAPDTGNLGVSALFYSVLGYFARNRPAADFTVFDEGLGLRAASADFHNGPFRFRYCGATDTRRLWQYRSYWNIRVSSWLGFSGNPTVAMLKAAHAVMDISGGDSFSDLYGPRRFHGVTFFKRLVLERGCPLVLLPQTYGPFRDRRRLAIAESIVRRSAMAWARDARSFDVLKELLGRDFDPSRHRSGVDVAFSLPRHEPDCASLGEPIARWLSEDENHRPAPLIGFNVSGLVWNDPVGAKERFGFRADYRECVLSLLRRILKESDARILLIPHVLTPSGHYESDSSANSDVVASLVAGADREMRAEIGQRVALVPPVCDPMETKGLISRMDWFCGTRMHATIAGLSSGVPTATLAYSFKSQGVFESCGQGDQVVDPRTLQTPEVCERLFDSFKTRAVTRRGLSASLSTVLSKAAHQLDALAQWRGEPCGGSFSIKSFA